MSQQALSKARNKFDHTPFWKLFIGIHDAFYSKEYLTALSKMYDKFIIAIDGSDTELPDFKALYFKRWPVEVKYDINISFAQKRDANFVHLNLLN